MNYAGEKNRTGPTCLQTPSTFSRSLFSCLQRDRHLYNCYWLRKQRSRADQQTLCSLWKQAQFFRVSLYVLPGHYLVKHQFGQKDGSKGGWSKKYRSQGNNIVIQHSDNSRSGYWHLQKDGALVKVGDTVKQGQVIGLSGKTGYAAMPHLHFIVWKNDSRGWQQVATRFQTSKGIKYLRPWKWYRNKKETEAF